MQLTRSQKNKIYYTMQGRDYKLSPEEKSRLYSETLDTREASAIIEECVEIENLEWERSYRNVPGKDYEKELEMSWLALKNLLK